MDSKPPIQTPPAQRWREIRIQLLPIIIFILVVIAVALLWRQVHTPVGMIGEVSTTSYQVRSLVDGAVLEVLAEPFSKVKKGQLLARVLPATADVAAATMASETAMGEMERLRTSMNISRGYLEITSLELQKQKAAADLEIAKADLPFRQAELDRYKQLMAADINSKALLDSASSAYDKARVTVEQLTSTVQTYDAQLKSFGESQRALDQSVRQGAIDNWIRAQTNLIGRSSHAVELYSPADGVIATNSYAAGESVRAGESVVTVAATNGAYIVGYLRQPAATLPNVDDEVQVTSRNARQSGPAKIVAIGADFSLMDPTLISADNTRPERALKVKVSMPAGVTLRPGELVDIAFVRK